MLDRSINWVLINSRRSQPWIIWCISSVLVFTIGAIDFWTGHDVILDVFYMAPIAISACAIGRRAGIAVSVMCCIAFTISHLASHDAVLHPLILCWKASMLTATFVIVAILVSGTCSLFNQERLFAGIDSLTGLMNRRAFLAAGQHITRHDPLFSILYIDLDGFKDTNDVLGHHVGDCVLRSVANIIRDNTRLSDISTRIGGDEFAILLPSTDRASANSFVAKLKEWLSNEMTTKSWRITFSIGVGCSDDSRCSLEDMIVQADKDMYASKRCGKNGSRLLASATLPLAIALSN